MTTDDRRLEHLLGDVLSDGAPTHAPELLRSHIVYTTSRARPRSRWLADIKERPMRLHNKIAAGSPALRLTYVVILTLLLAILATGTVVAGAASLLPGPATIIVASDGSGTVTTIGEGVEMAEDGDTILIRPGTYPESVIISDDITVRGDGPRDSIVLDFTNTTATTQLDDGDAPVRYAILLDNGKAKVSDLTIRGPIRGGIGVQVIGGAPTLGGLSIEIKDFAASGDESMPIGFFGGAAGTVSDSVLSGYIPVRGGSPKFLDNTISGSFSIDGPGAPVLRGNHFLKDSGVGMSFGGSPLIEQNEFNGGGIGVDTGSDPTIRGNIFRGDSTSSGWAYCAAICLNQYNTNLPPDEMAALGVSPEDMAEISAVIEGNEIANATVAISVTGAGATPTISRNTVRDSRSGISIGTGVTAVVQENELDRNATGISLSFGDSVVTGNRIRGSSAVGLSINGGAPLVTGNRVEDGATGISFGAGAKPVLADNFACGNEVNVAKLGEPVAALDGIKSCDAESSPVP